MMEYRFEFMAVTAEAVEVGQNSSPLLGLPGPSFPTEPTFFERIGREDLKEVITPQSPWVLHSLEIYLDGDGFRGGGGLGILMGDMIRMADRFGIPTRAFSVMYSTTSHQVLDNGLWQEDQYVEESPRQRGFQSVGEYSLGVNSHHVEMDMYKAAGRDIFGPFEPGINSLYFGSPDSDHRLYQQAAEGFANYYVEKESGIKPAVDHLQEVGTALIALAKFDDLCDQGLTVDDAITTLQKDIVLTNHTIVAAAAPRYSKWQFEHYVFSNMRSEQAKTWLGDLIDKKGGTLDMSTLAHTFAGRFNGVSIMHAAIASGQFGRADNTTVDYFEPITNGIDLERWTSPDFYDFYQSAEIIDRFDLPADDYSEKIAALNAGELRAMKDKAGSELRTYLRSRVDQYGQSVQVPDDAKIACWTKRLAGYKRPDMLFENVDELKETLEEENVHILLSGKAHPEDQGMKRNLQDLLRKVDQDPVLKERVHFIQDYDEELASPLVAGVDIWFNTPTVGKEACGTSWMKALTNLAILISTEDGGVADVKPAHYLQIEGKNYDEEKQSLSSQFRKAAKLLRSKDVEWADLVKDQLSAYLPTISGARMWADYLNFVFPLKTEVQTTDIKQEVAEIA